MDHLEKETDFSALPRQMEMARKCREALQAALAHIKERGDTRFQDFHARRVVDMAAESSMAYLMTRDALHSESKRVLTDLNLARAVQRVMTWKEAILDQDQVWFKQAQTLLADSL